jgi:hypothetical protein
MNVPWVKNVLNGWTTKTNIKLVTQSVVNHLVQETETSAVIDANFQPMPQWKVNRKPEEQRTWIWWSIIVKSGPVLKTDDVIEKDGTRFRIASGNNWSESGFRKYEAVETFTGVST